MKSAATSGVVTGAPLERLASHTAFGVMATAAAGAVLHRLPAERAAAAVAIAGSYAGGLFSNFGSMMKGYHAGMAARGGLEARG